MGASSAPLGVVLAGGLARRMGGGDKLMRQVGGRSILARVLDRLAPQCDGLALNANGDPSRFDGFGLPVIADDLPGFPGPLAGLLAALDWAAAHRPGLERVLTAPGDCPFLPGDLVQRLEAARVEAGAVIVCAASGGRTHPVVGLWPVSLRTALREAVAGEGVRKVGQWAGRYPLATASWDADPLDPFFNVNTAEDLAQADRLAAAYPHL